MDERQTQIREGAGLEESQLNQDFVDFLKKWSTPVLLVIVAISLLFVFLQKREERRDTRINEAYVSLGAASGPTSLIGVASDFEDIGAVSHVARLSAADAYLESVFTGLKPGAQPTPEGKAPSEDEIVSAEDRTYYLDEAFKLYERVWQSTNGNEAQATMAIGAAFGLASVEEMRGDGDEAAKWFGSAKTHAETHGFAALAEMAQERLDTLEDGLERKVLLSSDDLPRRGGATSFDPPIGGSATDTPISFDVTGEADVQEFGPGLNLPELDLDLSGTGIDPADAETPEPESPAPESPGETPEPPQR